MRPRQALQEKFNEAVEWETDVAASRRAEAERLAVKQAEADKAAELQKQVDELVKAAIDLAQGICKADHPRQTDDVGGWDREYHSAWVNLSGSEANPKTESRMSMQDGVWTRRDKRQQVVLNGYSGKYFNQRLAGTWVDLRIVGDVEGVQVASEPDEGVVCFVRAEEGFNAKPATILSRLNSEEYVEVKPGTDEFTEVQVLLRFQKVREPEMAVDGNKVQMG